MRPTRVCVLYPPKLMARTRDRTLNQPITAGLFRPTYETAARHSAADSSSIGTRYVTLMNERQNMYLGAQCRSFGHVPGTIANALQKTAPFNMRDSQDPEQNPISCGHGVSRAKELE